MRSPDTLPCNTRAGLLGVINILRTENGYPHYLATESQITSQHKWRNVPGSTLVHCVPPGLLSEALPFVLAGAGELRGRAWLAAVPEGTQDQKIRRSGTGFGVLHGMIPNELESWVHMQDLRISL